jgi:hypothetical protein
MRRTPSSVAAALCGVITTLGRSRSGMPSFSGSSQNTSRPAAATWPERRPAASASSSTSVPRAVFTSTAPRFMLTTNCLSTRRRVSSLLGQCRVMASASASPAARVLAGVKPAPLIVLPGT